MPCDQSGHVALDDLPDRLRNAYFCARALVGQWHYLYSTSAC
ncbi:hypothetical protein ACCUM_4239 [Candidatus Accumulibacter phosphatis]|uniref:Uncharacterized protein n=1 Tax=Candidatus Accumulibacter phosphatis TaxID=327160 RepID=A0A5S4F1M2_9PROT|nr:hypothetical protein ACCUM_4239 [Candidatus Accumulibacter phosphatis]